MEKENKFLTLEKVQNLHKSVGFLNDYTIPENEYHFIGPNINTENINESRLLRELAKINKRKEEIINQLMSK